MTSYSKGLLAATPDAYAASALSRCTSGANAGILKHDLILTLFEFIADIAPLTALMGLAAKMSKKNADKVKAKSMTAAQGEQRQNGTDKNNNGYQKLD